MNDTAEPAIDLGSEAPFSLGTLLLRPASREVVANGQAEMIEPRVMQAFVALTRRRGEVISRDQLAEACWAGRVVGDDAINRCIAKVRRWASATTFELETIPRVGYRLVAAAEAVTRSSLEAPTIVPASAPVVRPSRARKLWLIAAGTLTVIVAIAGYWGWRLMEAVGATSLAEVGAMLDVNAKPHFAVLPFDKVGSDIDTGYLADAIPTAINNQLIALGFQVVSPAVAMQYRGDRKARAAMELEPRYVIDGSVRVDGEMLHVTARVDWTQQPVSVWSRDFTVNVRDASDLPNKIATTLASLSIFSAASRTVAGNSASITASVMRAMERSQAGDEMEAYLLAKDLLRQAPNAIVSQANYAILTVGALDLLPHNARADALSEARNAAKSAAFLSLWSAPVASQAVMLPTEWSAREQVLREALDANAQVSGVRFTLAGLLASMGRISEANALAREAVALDPLVSPNLSVHATVLDMAGQRDETKAVLMRANRLWPNREAFELVRFSHAIGNGDADEAEDMLRDPAVKAILEPTAERRPYAAIVRALSTRSPEDVARVEQECADPAKLHPHRGAPCLIALVKLNKLETFFAVAPLYLPDQRGNSSEERDARFLATPQAWRTLRVLFRADTAALRADERFISIVERMELLGYWRKSGQWPDFCKTEPDSVCARMRGQGSN